jgi:hypothetical protein
MDQTFVAAIRKNLETKSTEELRQAYESRDQAARSPEESEAMRQLLDERRTKGSRAVFALASAILFGSLGAVCAWWQGADGVFIFLAGVVCAILGFGSWYIRELIPRV